MKSNLANSRDSPTRHSNSENDVYEDYNNDIAYNEIQNFGFLQEIASNYHNNSNTLTIQSLSTSLLPLEQAVQSRSQVNEDHEDTVLHCTENHSHALQNMNLDEQYYYTNLDSILDEIISNDSEDATKSLEDLNLIDNTNIVISLQEITQQSPSRPPSREKLKRTFHTRNALYITNSLNKSLFNEGPATKKKRTPRWNSPILTSHQAIANTCGPSPAKAHNQSPLDIDAPSSLPIPHEFQFNHINESTMQINAISFTSIVNQNEDIININNETQNYVNLENFDGNKDIDITDLPLDTPILDDYNMGDNINMHDAILQFEIHNEFLGDQKTNFVDVPNHAITNDMPLNFEVPEEFPSIENFDLLDISNLVDSNARNLDNQCNNTSHTIAPLLYIEQTTQLLNNEDVIHTSDESNIEKDANEMALKAIDDEITNLKAYSQGPNEVSILNNANYTNLKSVYILDKDKMSLVSIELPSHSTKESLEKMSEKNNELQEESFVEMMRDAIEELVEELDEESNGIIYCQESFIETSNDANDDEPTNEPYCQGSLVEMMIDTTKEPLVGSMYNNTEQIQNKHQIQKHYKQNPTIGVQKCKGGWHAILPNLVTKGIIKIGPYDTKEVTARARDLLALKLELHLKIKNLNLNFPLANYKDDLKEMKNWSEKDYIWSMRRQALGFLLNYPSGLKCVVRSNQKNPSGGEMWVAKVTLNPKKHKPIKGFKRVVNIDHSPQKEILGIFADLVNLHLYGWEYVTNFRPGHYTVDDVKRFIFLLEEKKVNEAYAWDLIKRVLNEPLPANIHKLSSLQIIEPNIVNDENAYTTRNNESLQGVEALEKCTVTESLVANLNPKDMGKHFLECPSIQLDELWALYKKPSDHSDLEFEDTIISMFKASNWSPSHVKLHSIEHKEYKFYFPCVIATKFSEVNIQRRILGLDYHQYLIDTPHTCIIEYYQKQWVNLPNIRYLDVDFYNVIACDGGLIAVKRERNDQNLSDQDRNKSTIIITNPLTYDIKFLPPIPYKILQHKVARLVFYDSSRTTYRLIVIGVSHIEETIHDGDILIFGSTQISLVVYCSKKESWVHFEHILNAAPPFIKLGCSNIVVNGCSIYYGGLQISQQKKRRPKPVIFYFNINNSRRQQLIIDFTKAGNMYFIKVVEPPKLVQIGFNTKIYAVSRQARYKKKPDILFIIEVVVNKDGTPTGSYNILTQGIMPEDLYRLLFKKKRAMVEMSGDDKLPPWEVMASVEHIAIKVIGFDPLIAFYNVKDQKWNYTYFPYIQSIQKLSNIQAWRLIPGVYEPRWNAIP